MVDEPDLVDLIALHLGKAGFGTKGFPDADSFIRSLDRAVPDLVVLDLMLPDMDGFDICRYIKESDTWNSVRIIMLTARTEEKDKVLGLELGAEEYVTKPV